MVLEAVGDLVNVVGLFEVVGGSLVLFLTGVLLVKLETAGDLTVVVAAVLTAVGQLLVIEAVG